MKGDAPAKATVLGAPNDGSASVADYDNNDPRAPLVRVLGTIAPPARRAGAELQTAGIR